MGRHPLLLAVLALFLGSVARGEEDLRVSYLWTPQPGPDGVIRPARQGYQPCPGDLVFYTHGSKLYRVLFALAHSGPPYHVGIVVALPDGRRGLLEAGPWAEMRVYLLDALPRMHSHEGAVFVRRLRVPLSPEQAARLTAFAVEQIGKPFACLRVAGEGTPLRAHGWLGRQLFGSPRVDHQHWFCSELVVAASCVAGLLDPHVICPNTVMPRDLFIDKPHDLSAVWEKPLPWSGMP
jgi:hypothetical protein